MLVLSREKNESIMVGDVIRIFVVDIRGDKVRLGIDAPPETPVDRQEVYDAIKREGRDKRRPEPPGDSRLPSSVRLALATVERWAKAREQEGWHGGTGDALHAAVHEAALRHIGVDINRSHSIG